MVKKRPVKVGKIQFHLISPITIYISIITEKLTQFNPFVYIAQITILKVGNNSLSFSDKKLSNHLIMREKFCIIEK